MDTITELASDERRTRIALAGMTEPGDAVASGLVGKVGAVVTVGLLDSHAVLPGLSPVESGPSRPKLRDPGGANARGDLGKRWAR